MFRASLFTIAKTWKQSKCPLTDEWLKMWYIYHKFTCTHIYTCIRILSSHKKKEENKAISNKKDRPGFNVYRWKRNTNTNIWHHLFVEYLKMIQMNLFVSLSSDIENSLMVTKGVRGEG